MSTDQKWLIGITGLKGSGKDSFAEALRLDDPKRMERINTFSFAHPVYQLMRTFLNEAGVSPIVTRDNKEEVIASLGVSRRYILQTLGTEWGRNLIGSDIWVKLLAGKIAKVNWGISLVTDVRFNDEAAWIKEQGGILIRMVRPDSPETPSNHASEDGVDPMFVDLTVMNDGSMEDLYGLSPLAWSMIETYFNKEWIRPVAFPATVFASTNHWTSAAEAMADSFSQKVEFSRKILEFATEAGVVISIERRAEIERRISEFLRGEGT